MVGFDKLSSSELFPVSIPSSSSKSSVSRGWEDAGGSLAGVAGEEFESPQRASSQYRQATQYCMTHQSAKLFRQSVRPLVT